MTETILFVFDIWFIRQKKSFRFVPRDCQKKMILKHFILIAVSANKNYTYLRAKIIRN